MNAAARSYIGTFCHAPGRGEVECLGEAVVSVDATGAIVRIIRAGEDGHSEAAQGAERLKGFVLPGFCDLHVHAPQWPQLGTALDVPLEVWLQTHTFPLEARYSDLDFARASYTGLVDELLSLGTTTALYFASIHVPATKLLADICLAKGQRALIGKVAMDNAGECPSFYCESTDAALSGTQAVIEYIDGLDSGLIRPVVTPRFIPSCSDEALEGLGQLARSCGCHIQTHCSESDWQHGYVRDRHGMDDTDSLDRFGLLTRHTVLAHGNFLSDGNLDMIQARGAGIAHCPLSNHYFSNAVFPLRRALDKGVRVGLGTDIAGGPSASSFDSMRWTVASSRALQDGVDAGKASGARGVAGSAVDWKTAFYCATKGGAEALDLPVGTFEVGRRFDAFQIDPDAAGGTVHLFDEAPEAALQKIVYTASKANIAKVWVEGKVVKG